MPPLDRIFCRRLLTYPVAASLAAASVAPSYAQEAPREPAVPTRTEVESGTPRDPGTADEEMIVLSPFTVNSERDTGYQAQSTLAGSRLATPLKDIGAPISVYTKDFLADIGATNVNELLVFATGMEAGGAQGNFSGVNGGIGDAEVVGDGPRTNPQGASRSRGLSSPTFTRNYAVSDIPLDGYNTTSVTINRGPNSILFGIGSPSGVVENSLATADVFRNRNRIEHRLGENGGNRFILDVNRVLIRQKLALRLIGLNDEERYDQKPAFEDKRRIFATSTYQPFESTSISVGTELGKTRANRPITVLPFDSINRFWYEAGRPTFDWTFYDDPARNPAAATTNGSTLRPGYFGQAQLFGGIIIPYEGSVQGAGPGRPVKSTIGSNTSLTAPAINSYRASLFHPDINKDSANDGTIAFWETFNIGEAAISAALFPGGVFPAGLKRQSFVNYDAFPFHKRQIDETSRQGDDFRNFYTTIRQGAWKDRSGVDKVGVELFFNYEYFERTSNNAFFQQGNGNHIRVDVNEYLPDGRKNPNVGRPYVMGASAAQRNFYESERENRRATAYFRHDFKDNFPRLGRLLGRHTVTGLYEEASVNDINASTKLRTFGPAAEIVGAGITNFNRLPNAIVYIGPSITGANANQPLRLEPIRIRPLDPMLLNNFTMFTAPAGLVNGQLTQGTFGNSEMTVSEIINDASPRSTLVESQAFVLQSYWLDDHVITTAGWRADKNYFVRLPSITPTVDPTLRRVYLSDINYPDKPPFNAEGETTSFSVVVRWPQKLLRLPAGTDLSVFFNKSENFEPLPGRITAENVAIASPAGKTDEIGISLSLFDDKLNLRVNRFETSQVNAGRANTYGSMVGNFYRQLSTFWVEQENLGYEGTNPSIPQGTRFSRRADIQELLNALPGTAGLLNSRFIVRSNGTVGLEQDALPTFSDTQDYVSEGYEAEVIYNPTRNWRIAINFAKQETVLSNLAPGAKSVYSKLRPIWDKYFNSPRAAASNWEGPGSVYTPAMGGSEHLGTLVTRDAIIPYFNLIAQEGVVSSEQRKYRANLVTNYKFDRRFLPFLNGFEIGSGVRWQSKYALGYPTSFRPDGSVFVDINNPFWSEDDLNVDAWLRYSRKIYDGKVNWRIQLNFRNLIGETDPIAVTVQPDGSPAATRLPPEKRIYLTNTFEF